MSEEFKPPKYRIGDVVYAASREYSNETIGCPDCLRTLKWIVVFADGETKEVDCQTCRSGFNGPVGYLSYKKWKPSVRKLTIGKVYGFDDSGWRYMCEETGVGSGTVWDEKDLYIDVNPAEEASNENHREAMKEIAKNNFSKKFGGKKAIGEMLSTFGYTQRAKYEKTRQFIEWAKISELIKD